MTLRQFARIVLRLVRKIETNFHGEGGLDVRQDNDSITIMDLRPPLVETLKYVSGPDANGVYVMQPVIRDSGTNAYRATGPTVYMEG